MSQRARAFVKSGIEARAVITALDPSSSAQFERLRTLALETEIPIVAIVEANDEEWSVCRARELRSRCCNLRIERLDSRYGRFGRGAAIRYGIKCVIADTIAVINIDEGISAASLGECFELLESRPELDAVLTYRKRTVHLSPEARLRRIESRLFNAAVCFLFALKIRDVQSPIKVFRRSAMERVFKNLRLYNHGFDADLLFNCRKLHLKVVEVETPWAPQYREWDVVKLAYGAIAALLYLRLVASPIGSIPGIRLLGRHFWLPVKSRYRMLILCWRDPKSPNAGGGEVYLFEQARAWARLGHDVTWFSQAFKGLPRNEVLDGIKIVRRGRSLLVFPSAMLWYLFKSGTRFDFLIDTMNGIPFFTPLFSLKPKACLLFHVHSQHFLDELPSTIGRLASWVETKFVPFIYRRTRFITISRNSLEEMEKYRISRTPVALVHSGVSEDFTPGDKSTIPTVLYIGRLRRYKQIRKLIDAHRKARSIIPDLRLLIAGTGDDETALRAYGADDPSIVFLGRVDEAEKRRLMREAWVFGMPSAIEGWGITVIEAAASGTPAVAFDVSALRDCIVDGVTGLLASDQDQFTENLIRILRDGDLRSRLSVAARSWSAQFSWEKTALRMLDEIRLGQPWRAVLEIDKDHYVTLFDDHESANSPSTLPSRELLRASA